VHWSIVVKEKPAVGSPYFGTFPSDRMPKATYDVKVHFFIHSYYTTSILSANSGNILKLLRLVGQLTVEQLVLLTFHSYFLDELLLLLLLLQVTTFHSLLRCTLLWAADVIHNTEWERKTIRNDE
jgi:hypothetical protein